MYNTSVTGSWQMFSISESELRALAESSVEAYLERVADRLRHDFPAELGVLSQDELRPRVRVAFDRFRACNFRRKEHLHRLIVLELLFGPRFDDQLPKEVRELFKPEPESPPLPEAERFWAVYRAATVLRRNDPAAGTNTPDTHGRAEAWR